MFVGISKIMPKVMIDCIGNKSCIRRAQLYRVRSVIEKKCIRHDAYECMLSSPCASLLVREQNFRDIDSTDCCLEERLKFRGQESHSKTKAISVSPMGNLSGFVRSFAEKHSGVLSLFSVDRKPMFESPTPSKVIVPFPHGLSESL